MKPQIEVSGFLLNLTTCGHVDFHYTLDFQQNPSTQNYLIKRSNHFNTTEYPAGEVTPFTLRLTNKHTYGYGWCSLCRIVWCLCAELVRSRAQRDNFRLPCHRRIFCHRELENKQEKCIVFVKSVNERLGA